MIKALISGAHLLALAERREDVSAVHQALIGGGDGDGGQRRSLEACLEAAVGKEHHIQHIQELTLRKVGGGCQTPLDYAGFSIKFDPYVAYAGAPRTARPGVGSIFFYGDVSEGSG